MLVEFLIADLVYMFCGESYSENFRKFWSGHLFALTDLHKPSIKHYESKYLDSPPFSYKRVYRKSMSAKESFFLSLCENFSRNCRSSPFLSISLKSVTQVQTMVKNRSHIEVTCSIEEVTYELYIDLRLVFKWFFRSSSTFCSNF